MPVIQKYIFTTADGSEPILFQDWVKTLSPDEQEEFNNAKIRQDAIISAKQIEPITGAMVFQNEQDVTNLMEMHDPTWLEYFNRYVYENNMGYTTEVEQVQS